MRRRRELERILAEAETRIERPRYLHIRAEILIHDRVEVAPEPACPCCRSVHARIVERRPADDLVIDLDTGDRLRAEDMSEEAWQEVCEVADLREIPLRCSRRQADMLLDDTDRHLMASGGNRSGKSTVGLYWMAMQWLRHGGPERRFWLVASTLPRAYRLLEKLFKGTGGDSPPILPRELVARAPDTHRASDLLTVLVDGSRIDLKPFNGDKGAERAKSDPIVAALVDEAAHLPDPAWLVALRGRCVDLRGRLFFASTPRPSSWVKREIVDPALEYQRLPDDDERRMSGRHEGAAWHFEALAMIDNPWTPLANIERDMLTLDMSKADNQRDYQGSWLASEGPCWPDFDFEGGVHRVAWEHRDIARVPPELLARAGAAGHVPVTADLVRRITSRPNPHYRPAKASNTRFIIGQDVNVNPMQSVVLQVTAPSDQRNNTEAFHFWILDGVTTPHATSLIHAKRLVSDELSWSLDPHGRESALAGCLVIIDATSIGRRNAGEVGSIAETFGKLNLDVRAPMYVPSERGPGHRNPPRSDNFRLIHRLLSEGRLHVFSRCGALLNAFHEQIVEPDGECPIDSRRGHWDVVMGPMDALRYALWAVVNPPPAPIRLSSSLLR